MVIIIEGVDGTGKTTLANYLHELTGYELQKYSNHVGWAEAVGITLARTFCKFDHSIIYDRHHFPSNLIYGKIINGYIHPKPVFVWYINDVQKRLEELNTVMILCTASIETLERRLEKAHTTERSSYIVPFEKIRNLRESYEAFFRNYVRLPWIRLDSGELNISEMQHQAVRGIFGGIQERDRFREAVQ